MRPARPSAHPQLPWPDRKQSLAPIGRVASARHSAGADTTLQPASPLQEIDSQELAATFPAARYGASLYAPPRRRQLVHRHVWLGEAPLRVLEKSAQRAPHESSAILEVPPEANRGLRNGPYPFEFPRLLEAAPPSLRQVCSFPNPTRRALPGFHQPARRSSPPQAPDNLLPPAFDTRHASPERQGALTFGWTKGKRFPAPHPSYSFM